MLVGTVAARVGGARQHRHWQHRHWSGLCNAQGGVNLRGKRRGDTQSGALSRNAQRPLRASEKRAQIFAVQNRPKWPRVLFALRGLSTLM